MGDYPLGRALTGEDGKGVIRDSHIHERDGHQGVLVYTRPDILFNPRPLFFANETLGIAMNQNVSFTGFPTVIHAGVNSGALKTGTTDGTTTDHLIDAGVDFTADTAVGMSVKNTTSGNEYALVTAVANGDLTLDADIFVSGETYEINPIWVGTVVAGTWNFADSGKITITAANNNDEASFDNDTNQQWDIDNVTAFTGKVDLDTYGPVTNDILISFDLNGVQVGDTIMLNDYIDTGDFAEQSFVVPKADFNFVSDKINGMTILMERAGGPRPTVKFDDLQWEESGNPLEFKVLKDTEKDYYVHALRFSFVDVLAATVTNGTMPGLAFDQILGVATLTNGITFRRVQDGAVNFSASLKQLSDFLRIGSAVSNAVSDGTDTMVTLDVPFFEPIILQGPSTSNYLSLTVSDDLSGLTLFNAIARGVDKEN